MSTAAAFDTFIESILPRIGMITEESAFLIQVSDKPVDSVPMMIALGMVKSILLYGVDDSSEAAKMLTLFFFSQAIVS